MDEILRQILHEVKRLSDGQDLLAGRIGRVESSLAEVKNGQEQLAGRLDRVESGLTEVKTELKAVKELGQATFEQVGALTEFRTEMKQFRQETGERLDRIDQRLDQHGKVIERLTYRSIEQEADIVAIKRAK